MAAAEFTNSRIRGYRYCDGNCPETQTSAAVRRRGAIDGARDHEIARQAGQGADHGKVRGPRVRRNRRGAGLFGGQRSRQRLSRAEETQNERMTTMTNQATTGKTIDDRALDTMIGEAHTKIAHAMKSVRRPEARVGVVTSPLGKLLMAESDRGLATIHFLFVSDADRPLAILRKRFDLVENRAGTERIGAEIERYFEGDASVMARRIDLSVVESEFQRRALTALQAVPAGSVITYQGLAAAVGKPDSQRAIGNTMASNPIPIVEPC